MRVAKWQGLGNHFLVVERPPWPLTPERVRLLCDVALGLGADGVLEVSLGDGEVAVVVHNRDGSIAEVSGNGTRIAVAYAGERLGRIDLRVRTGAGVGEAWIGTDGRIAVRLGQASLEGPQEDLGAPDPGVDYRFVSTGNPHCVLTVEDPAAFDLSETGPRLERHPRFPERTNVEAVTVLDRHRLRMRVWERGVGETQACGSGACAAAVAAIVDGYCESPVTVDMPGGSVEVGVDAQLGLTLTGTAQRVYVADLDPALLGQLERAA
ncbi:MAG: diaminopimelate epimerase [Actinomycetota bacterium]|nr:diaminopimelate epimerase [Actinomycetota bacterium]